MNITLYKIWAFALASFMTGVAGCLLAALNGVSRAINFQTQDSLTLAATALIGGIFSVWGAIIAGVFNQLLPFLFQAQWSVNPNFLLIVFGAGLLQVLLSAPGGLIDQFPKDMANLGRLIAGKVPVTRQAVLGIGSIVALILGIVLLATVSAGPRRRRRHPLPRLRGPLPGLTVIEIEDLTVRFAGVTPIDDIASSSRAAPAG